MKIKMVLQNEAFIKSTGRGGSIDVEIPNICSREAQMGYWLEDDNGKIVDDGYLRIVNGKINLQRR